MYENYHLVAEANSRSLTEPLFEFMGIISPSRVHFVISKIKIKQLPHRNVVRTDLQLFIQSFEDIV